MTFAAQLFGVVSILVVGALAFLIVGAWREDRRERLSEPRHESAAGQNISLPREWDPLADLLEDPALRRD
jgi:hypothetical protein